MGTSGGYAFEPTIALLHPNSPDPKTNVLIDDNGHACLTDFGLITLSSDEPTVTSSIGATTAQWMSPELLVPDKFGLKVSRPTKASDCYALGMVIYEVLSGQTPFVQYSNLAVVWRILEGERPKRPQGEQDVWFTDNIWEISERCWKPRPTDRISVKTVLLDLERHPPFRSPSNVNGGVEMDGNDRSDATSSDSKYVFSRVPHLSLSDLAL